MTQHQAWYDALTRKGERSHCWLEQPKPQGRLGLSPLCHQPFLSQGCATALIPWSSQHLQVTAGVGKPRADSQQMQISRASLEAKELSQFTLNEGLAQRGEGAHPSHSTGHWVQRLGILDSQFISSAGRAGNHTWG